MEADDQNHPEDKGYKSKSSTSSSCSSGSSHSIEQFQNDDFQSGVVSWSRAYPAKEIAKIPLQCRSSIKLSTNVEVFPDDDHVSCEERDLDELGDLLRRFDTFFREKVDAELQSVREFLHGMLSEQQIHLQQILSSRLSANSAYSQQEMTSLLSGDEGHPNVIQDHKVPESVEESEMQVTTQAESTETYKRSATSEILIEIMCLSCELSALLSQSKFL